MGSPKNPLPNSCNVDFSIEFQALENAIQKQQELIAQMNLVSGELQGQVTQLTKELELSKVPLANWDCLQKGYSPNPGGSSIFPIRNMIFLAIPHFQTDPCCIFLLGLKNFQISWWAYFLGQASKEQVQAAASRCADGWNPKKGPLRDRSKQNNIKIL